MSNLAIFLTKTAIEEESLSFTFATSNFLITHLNLFIMKRNYFLLSFMALGLFFVTLAPACKEDEETNDGAVTPTGVTLDSATLTLIVGDTKQLDYTVQPSNAVKTVTWGSTATTVATVSAEGFVTAVAEGEAKIVVTTTEGGLTDTCTVKVNLPLVDWAVDSTYLVKGVWYKVVREGEVAVVHNPAGQDYKGTITIPSTVNGYTVKYIGTDAFAYGDDTPAENTATSVTLPSTIVSIGTRAFRCCTGLKSIVIPNTTTALWDDDFDGVNNAESEGATFVGCVGLEEITIGSGITDLCAPNGLFHNYDEKHPFPNMRKITYYGAPLELGGCGIGFAIFGAIDATNVPLFIPVDADIQDFIKDYWWNFASADQLENNAGAGIYHIGDCLRPRKVAANITGNLTWAGDAGAYEVLVSPTELSKEFLATATTNTRTTDTEYDISDISASVSGAINYVYLRGDCGDKKSEWIGISFFYYTGATCEYTIQGDMYNEGSEPGETGWGWYGSHVQITQNGKVVADVRDPINPTTVSLISGVEATFKWIGSGDYSNSAGESKYPSWFKVTNAAGVTVVEESELYDDQDFGPVSVNCGN
jgi:hypothetical protein